MATLRSSRRISKPRPHPALCDCSICSDRDATELACSLGLDATSAQGWPESEEVDGFTYELGPDPADTQWWADQTPDAEGLTADEDERFGLEYGTDSALDVLLAEIEAESATMDRYERGCGAW